MAKRDILKEAIADAKTVKETAIANAKAALEEAFTPRLKEMLATKLEEMELDEEKEETREGYSNKDGLKDDSPTEIKSERGRFNKSGDVSEGDDKSDSMEEEINLDEILAEIELDEEKKEEIKEDEATDKEEEGYIDGEEDADEDKDEEELDLDDMSDDDLKGFIEDVIADMVASGDLEAGENFEEEDETEEVVDVEDEVDVEISEDEEVKEVELDEAKAEEDSSLAEVYKEKEKMEEELKEAYSTIESLKSDLNEVNLLNGKLLYTNKIFKAKTLTEGQKVKVLSAFDKASTIKETKLVFETLSEGLKAKKKSPIKESLGTASRVSKSINTKKPIIEADPMVARFKKLAGIK
jgi:hypothetical protein